ncbi:MAG: prepilin-type N-terminal cleavage/methylation domain-containing protein, partial [Planctomycetota bacterium]
MSRGLTLVEMLVAMAVTLLIMAAVVTVFANISGSVTRRRATIEMSGTLRGVRELLAKDLAGATCPALPWRRPEANEGYLEIIEGPSTDAYPTPWLYSFDTANVADTDARLPGGGNPTITEAVRDDTTDRLTESIGSVPGLDLGTSTLPGSTLRDSALDDADDDERFGRVVGSEADVPRGTLTDGRGLGDADDTLMFTVRNEDDLFNGRIPARDAPIATTPFIDWRAESVESPLAEIAWFALENPVERADTRTFVFGDPGYRTIYRRVLLILPDLDYG